jgi:GNAT superfamily N-acetyltransferase
MDSRFGVRQNQALGVSSQGSMHLRPARIDEAERLTELCLQSKAVWGYDEAFMRACRAELTLRAADFATSSLQVAVEGNEVIGMVQVTVDGEAADLAKLFIAPSVLRNGAGRKLLDWAVAEARRHGARWMSIEADPDAAPFYRRMGAVDDGVAPSGSIPGRVLPRLKLML